MKYTGHMGKRNYHSLEECQGVLADFCTDVQRTMGAQRHQQRNAFGALQWRGCSYLQSTPSSNGKGSATTPGTMDLWPDEEL